MEKYHFYNPEKPFVVPAVNMGENSPYWAALAKEQSYSAVQGVHFRINKLCFGKMKLLFLMTEN